MASSDRDPSASAAQTSPITGAYTLTPVYRRTSPDVRDEAIAFWFDQGALRESCVAHRRSHELVYLAHDAHGRLAGATSVSLGRRTSEGLSVYDFRIFVAPAHRRPALARELTIRSRDLLGRDSLVYPAAGMRLFAEDPKLRRPGIRRYLERLGFVYRGPDRRGQDVWFCPFRT